MIYIHTIDLIAIPNEDIRFVRSEKRRIDEDIDDDLEIGDILIGTKDFIYQFENVKYALGWTSTLVRQIIEGIKNKQEDIFINPVDEEFCLFDRKLVIKQNSSH